MVNDTTNTTTDLWLQGNPPPQGNFVITSCENRIYRLLQP